MHWAQVGMKCECVVRNEWVGYESQALPGHAPVRGQIYTIEELDWAFGNLFLRLAGLSSLWHADAFRPLSEKDAELFAQLLEPLPQFADLLEPVS